MPSSFAKNRWIHRCLGCIAACGIAASYVLILRFKVCQMPMLSHEEYNRLSKTYNTPESVKQFTLTYYDWVIIYHQISFACCIFILFLSVVNIVPKHQDLRVMIISFLILLLGSIAFFMFYTAFVTFNKPCKTLPNRNEYKLGTRPFKDKGQVNVYEDEDDIMLQVTAINAGVGFLLLCSSLLYCFDSRQEMIEWRN